VNGRRWAYVALVLGVSASVAANVAHAWIGRVPTPGAVVASVLWPVLVLVAVELLSRTQWPTGWAWGLCRFGGVGLVGLVAALVSYRHMSGLLMAYGEDAVVVQLGPLAVDGLMVMATAALLAHSRLDGARSVLPAASTSTQPKPSTAPPRRSTTAQRPATVRPSSSRRPVVVGLASSTVDERVDQVRRLIDAGELPVEPSAEAIRRAVGGSAAIARQVRDRLARPFTDGDADKRSVVELDDRRQQRQNTTGAPVLAIGEGD
jgi:hypothetical protein